MEEECYSCGEDKVSYFVKDEGGKRIGLCIKCNKEREDYYALLEACNPQPEDTYGDLEGH